MRRFAVAAGLAALLLSALPNAFAKAPSDAKGASGSIILVFKDGHRQSFNLADISRVEFSATSQAAGTFASGPARGQFFGKWAVGDGQGNTFLITLDESGDAMRSLGNIHGRWVWVNGEARITWDDGAQDALRKAGSKFQKYAYGAGKSFTDTPDNVTSAQNTTPKPI